MNRCRFLIAFFIVSSTAQVVLAEPAERPNILFCFADDWGRYASIYAKYEDGPSPNQVVSTPNIDRVARSGVLFRNAFVNAPSCTPCRSSLLSGRYFFRTGRGAILQGAVWDDKIPAFPLLLKEAGYHIGKTAKVWSPGTPADAPYGGQTYAYQKAGMKFNKFSTEVSNAVRGGTSIEKAKEQMLAEVRKNFDDFLAAGKEGQPFCYWFGPTNTHRPWVKGSGKALWGIDPDSLKGKLPKNLPDVPEVREDFADYLGEAQAFDAYIGVLVKKLEERGQLGKTMIVISGDHGAGGFPGAKCNLYDFGVGVSLVVSLPGQKRGYMVDDLVTLIDLAPTFLEAGGVQRPDGMNGRSLMPLLKAEKSGQVDSTRTWVITGRERHVAAARAGNLPYPQRGLRTKDYLYIRNLIPERTPLGDGDNVTAETAPSSRILESDTFAAFADMDASPTKAWLVANRNDPRWKPYFESAFGKRPGEELYDLRKDRDQVFNIAGDPQYAAKKKELADQLMKILKDAGDPRAAEGNCIFERPPFTDALKNTPRKKEGPRRQQK